MQMYFFYNSAIQQINVTCPWSVLPTRECHLGGPIPFAYIPGEFFIAAILPFHERFKEGFLECNSSFYRSRMIHSTETLLYAVDLFNDPNGGFGVCSASRAPFQYLIRRLIVRSRKEAARFIFRIVPSPWNCTDTCAALLAGEQASDGGGGGGGGGEKAGEE